MDGQSVSYSIAYSEEAQKAIRKWKKSNAIAFKKLFRLLPELEQHPRTGIGHPEPLKGGNNITYSRRLTAHDRIIYDVYDDTVVVLIIEAEGHYDDK